MLQSCLDTEKNQRRKRLTRPGLAGFCLGCGGTKVFGEQLPGDFAPRTCSFHSLPASSPSSHSTGWSVGQGMYLPACTHPRTLPAGTCTVPSTSLQRVTHRCAHIYCPPGSTCAHPHAQHRQVAHLCSPAQGRGVPFLCRPHPRSSSQLQHREAAKPTTGRIYTIPAVGHGNSGDDSGHQHSPCTGAGTGGAAHPPLPAQAGFPTSPQWFQWKPECEEGAQKGLSWRRRVPAQ